LKAGNIVRAGLKTRQVRADPKTCPIIRKVCGPGGTAQAAGLRCAEDLRNAGTLRRGSEVKTSRLTLLK